MTPIPDGPPRLPRGRGPGRHCHEHSIGLQAAAALLEPSLPSSGGAARAGCVIAPSALLQTLALQVSTLVTALTTAGLIPVLDNPSAKFTVRLWQQHGSRQEFRV